jgi:hypothetical protein
VNQLGALKREDQRNRTPERVPDEIEGLGHMFAEHVRQRTGNLVQAKSGTDRRRVAEPRKIRSEDKALGRDLIDDIPPDPAVGANAVQQNQRLAVPDGVKFDHG